MHVSEHFEFRHFRPHYLDVDMSRECLHQRVVRNTIFRKAPPSVVSGYGIARNDGYFAHLHI